MDAFAITGVSRNLQWYRLEGVLGGEATPAELFPRTEVVHRRDVAALAEGRRLYYRQPREGAPLVPLVHGFVLTDLPLEDLPRFAFLEHANEEDVDTLLAARMGQDLAPFGLRLKRLEALDWIATDRRGRVSVTPLGCELLRHWLGGARAEGTRGAQPALAASRI